MVQELAWMKGLGMGGHQSHAMQKDEWLTPPSIISALGEFDLDPCAPANRPWDTAKKHYSIMDNGLVKDWKGRVWLNPPYGKHTGLWLSRLANHGNGIALIFARTDTKDFQDLVFNRADSVFFLRGRLFFHHVDGRRAEHNGGAPSCLIAYGAHNDMVLQTVNLNGRYVRLRYPEP